MQSLPSRKWVALGCVLGVVGCVDIAPEPAITPAPELGDSWANRQAPDAISLAQLLLTAIPLSLRQIAATNVPAVSSILWEEFLDDKKPQWFLDLPWDIQSYLVKEFGPETAWPPSPPTTSTAMVTPPEANWNWPLTPTTRTAVSLPSITRRPTWAFESTSQLLVPPVTPSSTIESILANSSLLSTTRPPFSSKIETSGSTTAVSATTAPDSPATNNAGLTRNEKLGLGVGIPFGILGTIALVFVCCLLLRRRRNKICNGTEPPSSPGFIPRFAFQDRSTDLEHQRPLNPVQACSGSNSELRSWEEDGVDFYDTPYHGNTLTPVSAIGTGAATMAMHRYTSPIMAPVIQHTHSSNRARGKRTSYSSLHSVAELSESDELAESPILGRYVSLSKQRNRRPSMPMVIEMPYKNAAECLPIKRKPLTTKSTVQAPATDVASQTFLRPAMPLSDQSSSSSSGLVLSTSSITNLSKLEQNVSPISPISEHSPFTYDDDHGPVNPFRRNRTYVEDYGPEYQDGYVEVDGGLYGGHKSLSRYPNSSLPKRTSKTEWPLRNLSMGRGREQSLM